MSCFLNCSFYSVFFLKNPVWMYINVFAFQFILLLVSKHWIFAMLKSPVNQFVLFFKICISKKIQQHILKKIIHLYHFVSMLWPIYTPPLHFIIMLAIHTIYICIYFKYIMFYFQCVYFMFNFIIFLYYPPLSTFMYQCKLHIIHIF